MCILWCYNCTPNSWPQLCQILTGFQNSSTERFCSKCAVKQFRDPTTPWICCHTALWNINFIKQAINDTLQGGVATYFRCGAIVNKYEYIKKGLLLSLPVKKIKVGEYLAVTSNKVVVSGTLCAWPPQRRIQQTSWVRYGEKQLLTATTNFNVI